MDMPFPGYCSRLAGTAVEEASRSDQVDSTQVLNFSVLACVRSDFCPEPGTVVRAVRVSAEKFRPPAEPRAVVDLEAAERFPVEEERAAWPERYGKIGQAD